MTEVTFYTPADISEDKLKFVVIAARYENQWVFVRHAQRSTWEIPGGHRETGETALEAAKRELWEETGAKEFTIHPVSVYAVAKEGILSYGMLYYADIDILDSLPTGSEIGEVFLSDQLPGALTYPEIQPNLFWKIQGWRNVQSGAGELWDIYDADRIKTGRIHRRGDPLKEGEYYLVVHVWMMNREGKFLLTKRSPNKGFPNMWESTGGSALAGDDSLTAALREVKEETGLTLNPERGKLLFTQRQEDYFRDIWLFHQDFDLKDVVLLPGETTDKMYASPETILNMQKKGEFVPYSYLEELFSRLTDTV